jgi:hypothetical protein
MLHTLISNIHCDGMQRLIVSDHHSLLDTDDGDHDVFIE